MAMPSKEPIILDFFRRKGYGTPTTVAKALNMNRDYLSTKFKKFVKDGFLTYDKDTRIYHLASDEEGHKLQLGLIRREVALAS